MQLSDAESEIKKAQPGTAIYGRFAGPDLKIQTGFFLREDMKHINAVLKNPSVEFRAAMFEDGAVIPVVIMLKIQGLKGPYETWWNYYQRDGGEKYFNDIIGQDKVLIHFYTETVKKRTVQVNNSLSDSFERFKKSIRKLPAWSMSDFDKEREKIYQRYPSVQALWEGLIF